MMNLKKHQRIRVKAKKKRVTKKKFKQEVRKKKRRGSAKEPEKDVKVKPRPKRKSASASSQTPKKRTIKTSPSPPDSPSPVPGSPAPTSPVPSSPVRSSEEKVDAVILDDSIDDSLLSTPDVAKPTKKENGNETKKRKAKDTPQSAPVTKKARRIESPDETPTRNNEPSDPDPPEKNLVKKLSLMCMQLAKQFSTSSDVEFDNFETSDWLSFDIENFIAQVIKNSKEQNNDIEMIPDTKLEAPQVAPNIETTTPAPNNNFFAFL